MGISRETTDMYVGGWCIRCNPETDITQINQSMKVLGQEYDLGDIKKMHRVTPSNAILSWQLASIAEQVILSHGQIPFLIQWDNLSLHPATQLPKATSVSYNLKFSGPTSTKIEENLLRLGLTPTDHITFTDGPDVSIRLSLQGEKGPVTFKGKN
jgi:hypothetical protein